MSEKSWKIETECFCPRCERYHTMDLFWTGNGIPKKFCKPCKTAKETNIDETFLFADKLIAHNSKKKTNE